MLEILAKGIVAVLLCFIIILVGIFLPFWLGWAVSTIGRIAFALGFWVVVAGLAGLISGSKDRIKQANKSVSI